MSPQWPMFREVLRRQEFMDDMMERCGVDMLALVRSDKGQSFAEARAKCCFCSCAKICREWLIAPDGELSCPPEFCPYSRLFRTYIKK